MKPWPCYLMVRGQPSKGTHLSSGALSLIHWPVTWNPACQAPSHTSGGEVVSSAAQGPRVRAPLLVARPRWRSFSSHYLVFRPALQSALYRWCLEHFLVNQEEQWIFQMNSTWDNEIYLGGLPVLKECLSVQGHYSVDSWGSCVVCTPVCTTRCREGHCSVGTGGSFQQVTTHRVAALLFLKREGLSPQSAGGVPEKKKVICFVLCCFVVFCRRFRITKITYIVSKIPGEPGTLLYARRL